MIVMLYNRPFKMVVDGRGFFPTAMKLPGWALPVVGQKAIIVTRILKDVKNIGPYHEEGLLNAPQFKEAGAPLTLNYEEIEAWMRTHAPTEEPEVVEWMISAGACNCFLSARAEEYRRAGSEIVAVSGDPWIPGVALDSLVFRRELAKDVVDRGYGLIDTPVGSFECPVPGKATGVFPDLLSWASIVEAFIIQWTSALLKFRELVNNPSSRIGFINTRGLTAPLFFGHASGVPAPVNLVEMSLSSDKIQRVDLNARSTDDYTDILFSDRFALSPGENIVSLQVFGFPLVPPMVIELQPENETSTILNYYKVTP